MLTDLVESAAIDGTSKTKQMCFQSVQNVVQTTLVLFPIYIHQTGKSEKTMMSIFTYG